MMTIQELYEYLSKYIGAGKGYAVVQVFEFGDNPFQDARAINDAAFIEWKDEDCALYLEIMRKKCE